VKGDMNKMNKQIIKSIGAGLAAVLVYAGGTSLVAQRQKINDLENQAKSAELILQKQKKETARYMIYTIEHGNPEGWTAHDDSFTGQRSYFRYNGDSIGCCWKEYFDEEGNFYALDANR
jgi:hypothetical protein